MFAFKFEIRTKKCPRENKSVELTKQLFQLVNRSKCTNTCPEPWPPLINGFVDDALLELSPDRN